MIPCTCPQGRIYADFLCLFFRIEVTSLRLKKLQTLLSVVLGKKGLSTAFALYEICRGWTISAEFKTRSFIQYHQMNVNRCSGKWVFWFIFFTKYLAVMVSWLTSVYWVSYVNVFKPSLKILFLELLPEEYLKLTGVVGWKLAARSWLLLCGEFPPLVLYWVLNKAASNIALNLLNMGIMIMIGICILWSCIRNIWWASVNMTLIWNMNTKAYLKCLSHFR